MFDSDFSIMKVKKKVHKCQVRFNQFREYLQLPGVNYDDIRNKIQVNSQYWDHIGRVSICMNFHICASFKFFTY